MFEKSGLLVLSWGSPWKNSHKKSNLLKSKFRKSFVDSLNLVLKV